MIPTLLLLRRSVPSADMDAIPRRWLLKPLSPVLQFSDLRTISTGPTQTESSLDHLDFSAALSRSSQWISRSPEEEFQAQHIAVYQDGVNSSYEWPPSSPSSPGSSSSGSQTGFYSFVEDPTSPEAELNKAWMVSPQRHAQLATLKTEKGFKLQTYANYRKPQSLFSESNGDSQYQVDLNHGDRALQEEDEKHLRKEIIRNQAPKKNLRLTEGSGVTSRTQQLGPAAAPSTVNMVSIDFNSARQQFIKFEQDQASSSFLSPANFCTTYMNVPQPRGNLENVGQIEEHLSQQSSVVDGLGSRLEGLSVEAAYGSSSKREASDGSLTPKYETPIEREIRLTQEREENLRRSRGLKISTSEIVEIRTKRLQSPQTPTKAQGLHLGIQQLQGNVQKRQDPDPEDARRKDAQNAEVQRSGERPESGDTTDFFSPCCPHQHTKETEFHICNSTSDSPSVPVVQDTRSLHPDLLASSPDISPATIQPVDRPWSWRETLQLKGLQPRKAGAPSIIQQEIEEVLKREEELRELRDSSSPHLVSPGAPLVNQATTHGQPTTSAGTRFRLDASPKVNSAHVSSAAG